MMRFSHYEVMHAVLMCGSVSSAAKFLNLSQPAVSRLLVSAERQLGFDLFVRTKNRLVPTQEALALKPDIDAMLAAMIKVQQTATRLNSSAGDTLTVACVPSLSTVILPTIVQEFVGKNKSCQLALETMSYESIVTRLLAGTLDIGFVFESNHHPAIQEKILMTAHIVAVCPPGVFSRAKKQVSVSDLHSHQVIQLPATDLVGSIVAKTDMFSQSQSKQRLSVETNILSLQLAEKALGIAVVDSLTATMKTKDKLEIRPITPLIPVNITALTLSSRTHSVIAARFISAFRQVCHRTHEDCYADD